MGTTTRWVGVACAAMLGSTAIHAGEAAPANCAFQAGEIMVTVSDPPAGRADQYNHFLNLVHLPEIVDRMQGFAGAQRFRVVASIGSTPWSYVSAYALEAGNRVATEGMKTRPGVPPVEPPAPYLGPDSAAWIVRHSPAAGGNGAPCARSEKLFVLLPPAPSSRIDLAKARERVPELADAASFEFSKATKGGTPAWSAMTVVRSHSELDVAATLRRLAPLVGCTEQGCAEGAGAVWALVPISAYVDRTTTDGNGRLRRP